MDFKSRSFCILPWSHLYFFTDGNVYPCPKLAGDKQYILGKTSDSIESLWNSEALKDIRKRMLQGLHINECNTHCNDNLSSCKKHVGLDLLDYVKSNIIATSPDGYAPKITFIGANIIDSNLCNFKCVYCTKDYSSTHFDGTVLKSINNNTEFYSKYLNGLKEIWLAGGEPVIQDSSYQILSKLISENNTDVRLRVITNLSHTSYKGNDFYKLISKFKNAIVFGSWDMDGQIGEYIREGSSSEQIKNTIRYINSLNIKFYLQPVISIFNIMFLHEFHKRLYNENLIDKDNIRYYPLTSPEYYRISILPNKIKERIVLDLSKYIKWLDDKDNPDLYANHELNSSYIKKIIKLMYTGEGGHTNFNKEENNKRLREFFSITNKNDYDKYGYLKFLTLYKDFNPSMWLSHEN